MEPNPIDDFMSEESLELDDIENLLDFDNDNENIHKLPEQVQNDGSSEDLSDEEEEEEEEGGYKFKFDGQMDPLSFAEGTDESGMQVYQRLEMIQQNYNETLAAKKRQEVSELPVAKRVRLDDEGSSGAGFDELMESVGYGGKRKSRKNRNKLRGRRKGSKNKVNAEAEKILGDAQVKYALDNFEEAIPLLKKVILIAPNLFGAYHTLGLVYDAMGNKKRAFNFYLIAAHLNPKNPPLWKLLVERASEQGDKNCYNYCLGKAITADKEDIGLKTQSATLYVELGEYKKAAKAYEKIFRLAPNDIGVLKEATELYIKSGDTEQAVCILEEYMRNHANDADLSVVDLLMKAGEYAKALEVIEHAQRALCTGEIPMDLTIKAGICHVHLRQFEKAEAFFSALQPENVSTHPRLIDKVANTLMDAEQYESALNYYTMLVGRHKSNGYLHLRIAGCYESLKKISQAIEYYYKAIEKLDHSVGARLTLSSLLVKEGRDDEAISVLSPPVDSESASDAIPDTSNLWWRSGKIKLKLSQIYRAKGLIESFVDIIYPVIRETLYLETIRPKVKVKKRLSRGDLSQRVRKVREGQQTDTVFHVKRPAASSADLYRAARAQKLLLKRDKEKEAKKAAAIAEGIDWKSDDDDNSVDDSPQVFLEPPLPDFLKDESHHHLILDLCKSLSSLEKYWEALEITNLSLKLGSNILSVECKEELRTLGAQISYNISDPARGWESVKYIVQKHPHSFSAWNCCYKVILRHSRELRSRDSIHRKFLHHMRGKYKDSVPPIVISAHLFTLISQHQAAAREYLEAYKLMPDNPFINLCVGTAMINLALDIRLLNKHQTVLQGLAFLYNNSRLCEDSQESLYNIARAYHHIGLVSLAVTYYEKVLAVREKDYPIPVLPNENSDCRDNKKPGYCDLRREAAYNLHLIYVKSGALDLARQVLKDHVFL